MSRKPGDIEDTSTPLNPNVNTSYKIDSLVN